MITQQPEALYKDVFSHHLSLKERMSKINLETGKKIAPETSWLDFNDARYSNWFLIEKSLALRFQSGETQKYLKWEIYTKKARPNRPFSKLTISYQSKDFISQKLIAFCQWTVEDVMLPVFVKIWLIWRCILTAIELSLQNQM